MPLQNFIDKVGPPIAAAWLNLVDTLMFTIFGQATTKAQARSNLTSDLALELANGGTASRDGSIVPLADNTQSLGSGVKSYANLFLGANHAAVLDTVSGNIGYYARTAAEVTAGVTPTNFAYPPNNAFRYGFVGDGVADDTAALQRLFNVCQQGFIAFIPMTGTGSYKISGPLTWNGSGGGIIMEGADKAALSCTGSGYTAISIGNTVASQLNTCVIAVNGNNNTINGVKFGTSAAVANVQRSVINFVHAWNFNGFGIQINDCFDTLFEYITILGCGTNHSGSNLFAFSLNNVTGNSNMCVFPKIQCELAIGQAVFIDQVLTCVFGMLHSERATGDGTNPTHVLGGDSMMYECVFGGSLSNGLWFLNGTNCEYLNLRLANDSAQVNNNSNLPFTGNRVDGLICNNLTVPSSNINGWDFRGCRIAGTLTYTGQSAGILRFQFCQLNNITGSSNGSTCEFIDCSLAGTWTNAAGSPLVDIRGGICVNFPSLAGVTMDNVTVFNAYTTLTNQVIVATRCTFNGTITLATNGVNWRSDACVFSNVSLGAGGPGFLFGPRDRATGTVSAGLLQSPSAAGTIGVAYVLGDKGYNLQSPAAGSFAWTCTTAGSPGTFTNLTIP